MLKCYWQVTAGLILGEIDPKFTRRYVITAQEWAEQDQLLLLTTRADEAARHARQLQVNSSRGLEPNWVTTEYVWM